MKIINSIRGKITVTLALLVVMVMTMSCSEETSTSDIVDSTDFFNSTEAATVNGSQAGLMTVANFNALAGEYPESIAVDRFGNIYVSMTNLGEIWKLNPSGSFEEVMATFPVDGGFGGVAGLRFDVRGALYAVNSSADDDVRGVWKIETSGEKVRIAGTSGMSLPNDVAILPNGVVYITDSVSGAVWRALRDQPAEMWVQDEVLEGSGAYGLGFPIGANGIAIVPGGLMVANAEKGQLVSIPILSDGSAGQPTVVIVDPAIFGLDAITADARGNIYGAVNIGFRVVRISSNDAELSEIASGDPLDFPTGLTFGSGRDRHTLFIVNAAFFNPPDVANPAVLSLRVSPGQ